MITLPPFTIEKSKRKTATIRVYPDDRVVVKVPNRMPTGMVEEWVRSKADWIQKRLHHNALWREKYPLKTYRTGETCLYLGNAYVLSLKQGKRQVALQGDCLQISHPSFGSEGDHQSLVIKLLSAWYKAQAQDIISDRLAIYAPQIGKPYGEVRFKKSKTRWGSCSIKGNLNFNWALMMAPLDIIDYVVVHELCHLVHHHHRPSFWKLVARYFPQYQDAVVWLKRYGPTLLIG